MPGSDKYTMLEEIGSGGMGRIFRGLLVGQAGFRRPIIIKQLWNASDQRQLRLFVAEARRYAVLDHENIGRIFDFEELDGQLCLIMEYIDGWTLGEYLDRHRELSMVPGVELSVFIVSRVCRALQYVYESASIVHRDVSPSNVMMTREGTVKLIDFGIATRGGTRDDCLTGKPAYMAPEMVREMWSDHRSDVFSLGVVLFELLSRERLFEGSNMNEILGRVVAGELPSPRESNPDIPDTVLEIVQRALQRNPDERFANAADMGAACEHVLYDKGYGPTNLTLKQYLQGLFPAAYNDPEAALTPLDDAPDEVTSVPPPAETRPPPSGPGVTLVVARPHTEPDDAGPLPRDERTVPQT